MSVKRSITIGTMINVDGDGTFKQNFKIVIMEFLQEVHCMLFLTLEDDDASMPLPTVNSYQELSELLTNTSQSMDESSDSDSSDDSSATKKTYTGEGSSLTTQMLLYFKQESIPVGCVPTAHNKDRVAMRSIVNRMTHASENVTFPCGW